MRLPAISVEEFKHGVVTRFEDETIPRGASSDSLNWMSRGDHIELRGGQALTGTAVEGSSSPVTGLKVAARFDGTLVPFYTHGRKLKYYDLATDASIEVGSNLFPEDAEEDDFALQEYHSLAGAMLYVSSPNSSFYKIPIANPGSAVNQSMTDHRGRFKIKRGRTWLWKRLGTNGIEDPSGLYGSYLDKDELADYTFYDNESYGTGNGILVTFAHTLTNVSGKKTAHYVSVTDGVETFYDDRNGVLMGSLGGTGTVNYATGAVSVTFATAVVNLTAITCDYYVEDSTDEGILDFSKATPRAPGEGFVLRQDDGGAELQNIGSIDSSEFSFHTKKTWRVSISSDDADASNPIFRSQVGIPHWRALAESGDGLYYVDAIKQDNAYIRLLVPSQYADNKELPKSISDFLDLSPYRFDKAAVYEWGDYLAVACRTSSSTVNNRVLFYNKLYGSWDVTDIRATCFDDFNGTLLAGDSGAPNLYTLFSGLTDDDVEIPNYWISGNDDLDSKGKKIANQMVVRGIIDRDQNIGVYLSLDLGPFVLYKIIQGTGSYVSSGQSITIGSPTIGTSQIGGGETGLSGHPYEVEFPINTELFKRIRVKFQALNVGIATVSGYEIKDIRFKGRVGVNSFLSD